MSAAIRRSDSRALRFKRRFIYPFRWFYQSHIWGLRGRIRYVRLFASAVWHWDSCDYVGTLELMRIAFAEISRAHRESGHVADSPIVAKQTAVVAELCRRLEADDYYDLARNEIHGREGQAWAIHVGYLGKQDAEYLGRMLRHIQCWWQ